MTGPRSIFVFADGSQETHSGLRQLLYARAQGSLLSRFLGYVKSALQEEVSRIPKPDRDGLPEIYSLHDLLQDNFCESRRHPALHPAEIALVQLGHFIA